MKLFRDVPIFTDVRLAADACCSADIKRSGLTEAYGEDLAYIHDAGFGDVAAAASEWLIQELRRLEITSGTVTDLGCGSGLLAAHLVQAGYSVLGVDISPAFIEMARRRVPGAEFVVESCLSVELPPSVAITAVGEVLNYTFDETNGPEARRALLNRAFDALVPNGLLVFDMAGPSRASKANRGSSSKDGSDWSVSATWEVDQSSQVLTRYITSCRQVGATERRNRETHRLLLAEPVEVLEALRAAGFKARVRSSYGSHALPQGVSVFLGQKTGGLEPPNKGMHQSKRRS